jgi:signal peptidase I
MSARTVTLMLDSKLRDARRLAKTRIKEANKLLKRAKDGVSESSRNAIRGSCDETADAAKTDNTEKIQRASDHLGELIDTDLGVYRKPAWRESLEQILVAVLIALVLRSFVLEAFKIPSGSMIPTLAIGDQIFVNKWVYGLRVPFTSIRIVDFAPPKRGDVVVFIFPNEPHDDFIKRVIGVPGDVIEVRKGVVYVNNEELPREEMGQLDAWDRETSTSVWSQQHSIAYTEHLNGKAYTVLQDPTQGRPTTYNFAPTVVSPGHLFVMGDNRDHSWDSRGWGQVPLQNVLGRAMFVWWSWGKDGLDFKRLGTWIE